MSSSNFNVEDLEAQAALVCVHFILEFSHVSNADLLIIISTEIGLIAFVCIYELVF